MFLLKKRYWLTITLLIALVLVARQLPATWLVYAVQKAAPQLQVSTVSGSIWQGKLDYAQWVDRGHVVPLGVIDWRLNVLSLLSLKPCVDFSAIAREQSLKGSACYSVFGGVLTAKNIDLSLPIARVAPFFNVDLDGVIDAYVENLTWQNQTLGQSDMNLLWQQAALFNGSQWVALGDIQGRVNDDGRGGLDSTWTHVESAKAVPVAIDLQAKVSQLNAAKPRFTVNGTVAPSQGSAALNQMLQFIGEAVGQGVYRIDIQE